MAKTLEELEQDVLAVTSSLAALDAVVQGARIGVPTVMAFRCNHSGLYFPSDYVRQWGRLYGLGQGPDPVSEVLDTDYDTDPPEITPSTRSIEQIMHPVGHVRVQVDMVTIPQEVFDGAAAILAHEDKWMSQRIAIIRPKQLVNPRGRLRIVQAAWERMGRA